MVHKINRSFGRAIIEARSCERFHALIPHLDDELASFYEDLFVAEARHFHLFVDCAKRLTSNATDRLTELVGHENSILQQEESTPLSQWYS